MAILDDPSKRGAVAICVEIEERAYSQRIRFLVVHPGLVGVAFKKRGGLFDLSILDRQSRDIEFARDLLYRFRRQGAAYVISEA